MQINHRCHLIILILYDVCSFSLDSNVTQTENVFDAYVTCQIINTFIQNEHVYNLYYSMYYKCMCINVVLGSWITYQLIQVYHQCGVGSRPAL